MNKPFIDSRLEIRLVPEISGWGVFALQPVEKNVIVEIAPVIVYPNALMNFAIWSCQAEGIPSKDLMIDQYSIRWLEDGCIPLGWTGLYNHSDNNNCQFIADYERKFIAILTLRDISADEQLFVSYGPTWFKDKGYVKKYEF